MYVREAIVAALAVILAGATSNAQDIAAGSTTETAASAEAKEFFENQLLPILKRRCYACHSHESGKAKGGLVLDSRAGWEKGGTEGAAVVPGMPEESLLMDAVRYENYEMPPDQRLPESEISVLEKWIKIGAPDPRESRALKVAPEKLWALRPIATPAVPTISDTGWARDELDVFVRRKLAQAGLRPNGDADRYTLLRRVTFDLTGLPPTPEEIETFVSDNSNRAYEKVVERLLDSPGFGDHWARHWFDLSCYADLADVQGNVLVRDAWRYRDYVIAAFNTDKSLDRFIHEQLAGDLLPYTNNQQRREHIIATGYLAIGPWTLQNYIKKQLDADVVDHQIDRIGRTFLAQTVSCARCHDHKFDPVPTADYYALAGIFHSTRTTRYDGPGVWSAINEIGLPADPPFSSDDAQSDDQLLNVEAAFAPSQRQDASDRALAVHDIDEPTDSPIYRRGDFQNLGATVPRGFLSAIPVSKEYRIPPGTSGRLQLAEWLTDAENPLTSRVLVNRIWHHLFGKGIVRTVDYFGVHGEAPSHPELLDFLAVRMRKTDNWSLKKTIRRMVLSRTYQMSSAHNAEATEIDPDNRMIWQMPRRRLTAESIRDTMLSASGQLDPSRGGPSLGLERKGNIRGAGGKVNPPTWGNKIPDYIRNRRTVYLPLKRKRPDGELEVLSTFDFPHPSDIIGDRPNTTVATQALFLLNAPFVIQQAEQLSERLRKEEPRVPRDRVNRMYLLTIGRPASDDETDAALAFLDQCAREMNDNRSAAWTQLCHAVLASNAFSLS